MLQGSRGAECDVPSIMQAARDGITQFRDSLSDTNKRVGLSADRINGKLGGYVSKKYWCTPVSSRGCRHALLKSWRLSGSLCALREGPDRGLVPHVVLRTLVTNSVDLYLPALKVLQPAPGCSRLSCGIVAIRRR